MAGITENKEKALFSLWSLAIGNSNREQMLDIIN